MKKMIGALLTLGLAVSLLAMGGCCSACKTKTSKADITVGARKALKERSDFTISGLTGYVKGSDEDKRLAATMKLSDPYPKNSLRAWLIESFGDRLNDEVVTKLKSREDIVISGKTGEIKGTKGDVNPGKVICPDCGFPVDSLSFLIYRNDIILDAEN